MNYWKPFEVKAVQRIVEEFGNSIIDFGAGHSYFPDQAQFECVLLALRNIKNVILLLPSQDKTESLRICNERLQDRQGKALGDDQITANRWFIEDPSNYALAKHIVYTAGKTPKESAQEILSLLR